MEVPENQALESYYAALRNLDKQEREEFREIIKSIFNRKRLMNPSSQGRRAGCILVS